MDAFFEVAKQVVGWLVVVVVFALLYREAFERLLSQPLIVKLAAARAEKLARFGSFLKTNQAYIVFALGIIIAVVFKIDLVTALNGLVQLFPEGSMDTEFIYGVSGAIVSLSAMLAHTPLKLREGNLRLQAATLQAHKANYPGGG